jgi:hypothetical protein
MFASDSGSERATSIEDYRNTCSEFIIDISRDYKDWVDKYRLESSEAASRKSAIDFIVKTTNQWILQYADTIKKVDIVMNDGINKMAESTAGYPFQLEVVVNNSSRYTTHQAGKIKLNLKATPREGRVVRVGKYHKDQLLLISSSSPVGFTLSQESMKGADILDDYIVLDASACKGRDLISLTAVVEEVERGEGEYVTESRGFTTLILVT